MHRCVRCLQGSVYGRGNLNECCLQVEGGETGAAVQDLYTLSSFPGSVYTTSPPILNSPGTVSFDPLCSLEFRLEVRNRSYFSYYLAFDAR